LNIDHLPVDLHWA